VAVVVTGAAGFLGRALVADLAADGVPVVAVDRRAMPADPALAALPMAAAPPGDLGIDRRPAGLPVGVRQVRADLLGGDPAVADALRTADAVFHLAGRAGVRQAGPAAEAARIRDNVAATAAVLRLVPPATPVVVTSSSSVYGGASGRPSREDDPLRPLGGYNVGTGRPRTLADLARAVCRVLGAPAELVVTPAPPVEPAATWADVTLLRRRLGFVPVTDLDELVARQVAATPDRAHQLTPVP
jgi:nucleoside-diphosphate-sugar epimerase